MKMMWSLVSTTSVILSLLLVQETTGAGSFTDDLGTTHTWDADQPTVACGAMDALAFFHFGMDASQLAGGTFGERAASGSNYGGFYFDGNVADYGAHGDVPHEPELFPMDPTTNERAFLAELPDLSPSCSSSNYYCGEVNIEYLNNNGWPDVMVFGVFYSYLLSEEVRGNATANGVAIIEMASKYAGNAGEDQIAEGMVEVTERYEALAVALGVENVAATAQADKIGFCTAAREFTAAAEIAQQRGVRAMAAYLPYTPVTPDGLAGAFVNAPEKDTVLAMFEELGMAILHNDAEPSSYYENQVLPDYSAGTWDWNNLQSTGAVTGTPVPYHVDFWLYDDRVTLDFLSDAFAEAWPHPALVAKQYAYFPANSKTFSYRNAAEILTIVAGQLREAQQIVDVETTCTPSADDGEAYNGDVHRINGLGPGEYACFEPVTYSICDEDGDDDSDNPWSGGGLCFAGRSTVNLEDGRSIPMNDLKIGDRVQVTDDGQFDTVYSFGHYQPNAKVDYLRIESTANKAAPLTISGPHMVFLHEGAKAVPASTIQVGDVLLGGHTVTKIDTVTLKGAYAPFTYTGSIVVNDVVASNYVSLTGTTSYLGMDMQLIAHTAVTIRRMACQLNLCNEESYNEEGVATWIPLRTASFFASHEVGVGMTIAMGALIAFASRRRHQVKTVV